MKLILVLWSKFKRPELTGPFIRSTRSLGDINQPIASSQLNAFVCVQRRWRQPSIRMGKKRDLSDFERSLVVPDELVSAFQKLLIYWDLQNLA